MPSRGVGRLNGQPGSGLGEAPGTLFLLPLPLDTLRSRGDSAAAPAGEGETFETAPPLSPAAGRLEGGVRRHASPPRPPRPHAASPEKSCAPAPGVVSLRGSEVGGPVPPRSLTLSRSPRRVLLGSGGPASPAVFIKRGSQIRSDLKRTSRCPTQRAAWEPSPCPDPRTWATFGRRLGPSPAAVTSLGVTAAAAARADRPAPTSAEG